MPILQPPQGLQPDRPRISGAPFWAIGANIRFRLGWLQTMGLFGPLRQLGDQDADPPDGLDGPQVVLPFTPSDPDNPGDRVYRSVLTSPSAARGQMFFGASHGLALVEYDADGADSGITATRWKAYDMTPAGWTTGIPDTLPDMPTGSPEIPQNIAFAPQDDGVVILKCNDGGPVWWFTRDLTGLVTPDVGWMRPITNAPSGAVGVAVINRILVLLGCQSVYETGQNAASDPSLPDRPDIPTIAPASATTPGEGPNDLPKSSDDTTNKGFSERYLTVRWSDQYGFERWGVSVARTAGELQLEGGSRIVGGGKTRFGVAAWTDEALHILTFTGSIDSVFSPKKINGSSGLISNQGWCEAGGQLWWIDSNRHLQVYDGGQPVSIPNPMKTITLERLTENQLARLYMTANPEFDEIIIAYPDTDATNPETQLVYNTKLNAWTLWRQPRTCWHRRVGAVDSVSADAEGMVWRHEIDHALNSEYIYPPGWPEFAINVMGDQVGTRDLPEEPVTTHPRVEDVTPFTFTAFTNGITTGEVTTSSWLTTKLHFNTIASYPVGHPNKAEITVEPLEYIDYIAIGYGEARTEENQFTTNVVTKLPHEQMTDVRVSGKAIQVGFRAEDVRFAMHLAEISYSSQEDGER